MWALVCCVRVHCIQEYSLGGSQAGRGGGGQLHFALHVRVTKFHHITTR